MLLSCFFVSFYTHPPPPHLLLSYSHMLAFSLFFWANTAGALLLHSGVLLHACVLLYIHAVSLSGVLFLPLSGAPIHSSRKPTAGRGSASTWGRERQRNGGRSRDEEASYSEDQRGAVVVVVMGVRDGDAAAEHDSGAGAHDGDAAHLQAGPQRRHAPLRLPRLLLQPHCRGHRRAPCPHLRKVRTPLSFTAYVLLNCSVSSPLLQCFLFQYCCGWSMITYAWLTLHSCATGYYFKKRATCFFCYEGLRAFVCLVEERSWIILLMFISFHHFSLCSLHAPITCKSLFVQKMTCIKVRTHNFRSLKKYAYIYPVSDGTHGIAICLDSYSSDDCEIRKFSGNWKFAMIFLCSSVVFSVSKTSQSS